MAERPIFTPPVQVSHLYYRLARVLVWGGTTRYYKVRGVREMEHIPPAGTPAIVVSNHQNGMMDPLVSCAFVPQQIHWLTRADVFWNKLARHIIYGFNQMPIYRQRDRLADIRHRNDLIFDICVERLRVGAAMGIFPEGNHNPFPSLRPFKGGLAEMVSRSASKYPELRSLHLMPVGVEYEDYTEFRRQLRVRTGPSVRFDDLIDANHELDKKAFNERLRSALNELVVNIQPADAQPYLHPAVRALRPTEQDGVEWQSTPLMLQKWASEWADNEAWKQSVKDAHDVWLSHWKELNCQGRPEAWGWTRQMVRETRWPSHGLRVLGWLANAPSYPLQWLIQWWVGRTVKKAEFVSTMRLGYGMLLFPLYWMLLALLAGSLAPVGFGWPMAAVIWVWGHGGSHVYAWSTSLVHMVRDRNDGLAFWNASQFEETRKAWTKYVQLLREVG